MQYNGDSGMVVNTPPDWMHKADAAALPLVSVVIPAYNNAATIAEALRSVAAQSYANGEVIVVDDGSTDALADAVRGSGVECRLIRQANAGPAAARNHGIGKARGEWIAFLDGDDVWMPERLRIQFELVRQYPDAAMVCGRTAPCGVAEAGGRRPEVRAAEIRGQRPEARATEAKDQRSERQRAEAGGQSGRDQRAEWQRPVDEETIEQRGAGIGNPSPDARRLQVDEFLVGNPVATSTVLVRKETVIAVGGFDESFRGPEDYDLWIRIAARFPIVKTRRPLALYRHRPGSLSLDDRTFLPQVLGVLRKAYGPGGALRGRRGRRPAMAYQYLCGAWAAMGRGDAAASWSLFFRSFLFWPFSFPAQKDIALRWGRLKLAWVLLKQGARRGQGGVSCS